MSVANHILRTDAGGKVLVADDEPMNRILMDDLLSASGFEVIVADSGCPALERAEADSPDAILLDVMMPGMDGFEVCRRLKSSEATRHIPVLMVTALADRASRIEGIEAGANDFVTKPVDTRDIPLRIRNAVRSKKLYDELEDNWRRLVALEDARDNLTKMIVHDMRSPLLGISGMLELLKLEAEGGLGELGESRVDCALAETMRLVELVNSLLDIGRMENGRMPIAPAENDIGEIVSSAVEGLGALTRKAEIRIASDWKEGSTFPCDFVVIRRVIGNLVGNALKFVPSEEGIVTIRIRGGAEGESVRIGVADNGSGISKGDGERIFELFGQSVNNAHCHTFSSGVGLTFCKLAVEAHGGRIGIDSEEGRGTEIWFDLPAPASGSH